MISDIAACKHAAVVVTDPKQADNPIVECNDAFLALTGYLRSEVIGRNCRFLTGPGTNPAKSQLLSEAIQDRRPIVVELLNYRKDGTPFLNSVMIAPLFDEQHDLTGFIGTQIEVSGHEREFVSQREDRARTLVAQLTKRQKQVLSFLSKGTQIKEISHQLQLSERTIKLHRAAMLKALDVRTNAEAIRIAVRARV